MSLVSALSYLSTLAGTIVGIKASPEFPTEGMSAFPIVLTYPWTGSYMGESAYLMRGLHTLAVDIHFSRANLPTGIEQMIPFIEKFIAKLAADPTLGGNVDTIISTENQRINYAVRFSEYNKTPTLVLEWKFVVKIRN